MTFSKRTTPTKLKCLIISMPILLLAFFCISKTTASDLNKESHSDLEHTNSFKHNGIDVSHHQGKVDWALVKTNGANFAFAKATEGHSYVDPRFKQNWEEMKNHGIIRGAYHFFHPDIDAKTQAESFIKTVTLEKGDLPPVLDIEIAEKVAAKNIDADIKTWLEMVEKHYGVKPIIYSSKSFILKDLSSGFNTYPLWIAEYSKSVPQDLVDWKSWSFWQYSQDGKILGINGAVDLSVFAGSKSDFRELLISFE